MMMAGYYVGQAYMGQSDETVQDERPMPGNWQPATAPRTNSTPAAAPHRGTWRKTLPQRGSWRKTTPPRTNWGADD